MIIIENTPTIETKRLILRKFTEDDVNDFLEIMSDEEVNTFLPWYTLTSTSEAREKLQKNYLSYYNKYSAYRYEICLKEDNKPIGYVVLSDSESFDLGYGLRKEFWHKGIITEATRVVVERIKNMGYAYITATHDVNNPRSGKVMKKLGMEYKYSYVEQWQPKDISVTFRMYQLNFDRNNDFTYMEYWNRYNNHFIERDL